MSLAPGTRLGPYAIVAPIGAGGMGEVYRARDERLKREVAIKVLPAELAADADRRARFEREARAASGLSHPNILSVYDIGSSDSTIYMAMEFVDGQTLKDLIAAGPVPTKKLLELAVQLADGLAAAHAAGIVHRDLKPQNVMISRHGFVKILDFGLAKLITPESDELSGIQTAAGDATRPGMVMGTVGYMSPEQAAGRALDFRSDQFSFGSILYEMATGKRAFERGTTAETLTAIIREEPPPVAQASPKTPAPLRWLVERCLAKDPEDRFGTTKDLARDLASVRDHLSDTSLSGEIPREDVAIPRRRIGPASAALLVAGVAAGLVAGYRAGKKAGFVPPPNYQQLTFRRGELYSARFAPDGQTVIYAAAWDGKPVEIFATRTDRPESRVFGAVGADVASISKTGEMLVFVDRHIEEAFIRAGTLAQVSVSGGVAPREIATDVQWADWAPDGASYALVRDVGGRNQLEYPAGKVLYQTSGWISHPRVSADGQLVAFLDHGIRRDDGGSVVVIDRSGKKTTLAGVFASIQGLAWSRDASEVWFTGTKVGGNRAVHAVTLAGAERLLARVTESLTLQDIAADGRVLVSHDVIRIGVLGRGPGDAKERDLSWLDWSAAFDLSRDGKMLLFAETGEGSGPGYSCFVRGTDGSAPVRLGDGVALAISPDGHWVTANTPREEHPRLWLYPTGPGEKKALPVGNLLTESSADWLPDGRRIVFNGTEPGHGTRVFSMDVNAGNPRALTPEGYRLVPRSVSPDGKRFAVIGPDRRRYFYAVDGGEPEAIPGLAADENPTGWSADGRSIYIFRRRDIPLRVSKLDVTTGAKELWKDLMPADGAGIVDIAPVIPTPDGKAYVYGYSRTLSDMYVVQGLK